MSNHYSLFNEDITYAQPKDDPLYSYFKEEDESTEPPFSLKSESPSFYNSNYYQLPSSNYDNSAYDYNANNTYQAVGQMHELSKIPEDKPLESKSKKIKREAAKKRTQMKKSTAPSVAKENSVIEEKLDDSMLDNSNCDDKSNKKMKQMIRNRISAQNSRDRKKQYVQNVEKNNQLLQMQNAQLLQEIATLKECNKNLLHDNEELKKALQRNVGFCPHCHSNILSPSPSTDERISIPTLSDDHEVETFTRSGGNSPIFSRLFGGSGRNLLSYTLTFATILSVVLVLNMGGTGMEAEVARNKLFQVGPMQNITTKVEPQVKEMAPAPIVETPMVSINPQVLNLPFLQQIDGLQTYFYEHGMRAFFNSLKVNATMAPCISGVEMKDNSIEIKNEIVEYSHFLDHAISNRDEIEKAALAPLSFEKPRKSKFSTLFCPTGFEFFDSNDDGRQGSLKYTGDRKNTLDTEYLQFYIPKRQINGVFREKPTNDFIITPNGGSDMNSADENTIYEIWCKVYQVRELASNI